MDKEKIEFIKNNLRKDIQVISRQDIPDSPHLDKLPEHWKSIFDSLKPISKVIKLLWENSLKDQDEVFSVLSKLVLDVQIVIDQDPRSPMYILYLVQTRARTINYWIGGVPLNDKSELLSNNSLEIPSVLRSFYKVHNGFLLDGVSTLGIYPKEKLWLLGDLEVFNSYKELSFDPDNYLAFCGDGGGNERVFNVSSGRSIENKITLDWDHETNKISKPKSFWNFFAELIQW